MDAAPAAPRLEPPPSLFADRRFVFYLLSVAASDSGYAVYAISFLYLAFRISGDNLFAAGSVLFAEFFVYAISFTAGPFVDRARDPRTVLLIVYPLQGLGALATGILLVAGQLSLGVLLALVVAISFLWNFSWTAANLMPPRLVPEPSLLRANAVTSAISGGNQIAGFAAGAALIVVVGVDGGAFLYAALNFAASALAIPLAMPRTDSAAPRRLGREFVEGWRYAYGAASGLPLLALAIFSGFQGFFSTAPPLLVTRLSVEFSDPSQSYGLLFAAYAVGNVVGSLVLVRADPRRHLSRIMIGATVAEGVLIALAVRATSSIDLSTLAWFAVGVVDVAFYTAYLAYLQARTAPAFLGRTLTNSYFSRGISRSAGALVIGALAATWSAVSLGDATAIELALVGAIVPLVFPSLRRLAFGGPARGAEG
jgi:hypothetical protein